MLETIFKRHSVRTYADRQVEDELVEQVLRAAMAAPSAGNQQPWQFIVIEDRQTLKRVAEIHPYAKMAEKAPLAILVCGDLRMEVHVGYWVQDCSAAAENMLLAVQELGLGAVWVGVYPVEARIMALRELFDLPKEVLPLALIPIGYPAEKREPVSRYDRSRIHYGKWQGKRSR